MKIKLWGTRGSIPTPSAGTFLTSRYGGDTTCFSIETEHQFIIIDGGSGLRLLGLDFARRKIPRASFFFSHVHWDHIQGFPFFMPAFDPALTFDLYGPKLETTPRFVGTILEKALRGQQQTLTFPVQLNDMPAKMNFHDILPGQTITFGTDENSKTIVTAYALNHPGGCLGYRIVEHRKDRPPAIFAVATDTEHPDGLSPSVQSLAQNADIFIYDSQYTDDEYIGKYGMSKVGWGHSTWTKGLEEAKAAKAKMLLLTHHDPMHDDSFISRLETEANAVGAKIGIVVQAATQFFEIVI